jgi:3-deoxy-manno-octulosonate cytidylyltransferase (CMP-KDO synthetase)
MPTTDRSEAADSGPVNRDFAIVIPARYRSTRFPGKPLAEIAGKPMIQRVWERCVEAIQPSDVFIATDDDRIRKVCESFGGNVLMTSDQCLTGTDRVAEAAQQLSHSFIVNVQGDEPMIDAADILTVAECFRNGDGSVVNAMAPINDEDEYWSRNVPKVVSDPRGRLQYMSRAPIPANKSGSFEKAWKQVCIYAFSREHLERFAAATEKGPLEAIEDIEILRFIEMGIDVSIVELKSTSMAVDTPEDLERVTRAISG